MRGRLRDMCDKDEKDQEVQIASYKNSQEDAKQPGKHSQ